MITRLGISGMFLYIIIILMVLLGVIASASHNNPQTRSSISTPVSEMEIIGRGRETAAHNEKMLCYSWCVRPVGTKRLDQLHCFGQCVPNPNMIKAIK